MLLNLGSSTSTVPCREAHSCALQSLRQGACTYSTAIPCGEKDSRASSRASRPTSACQSSGATALPSGEEDPRSRQSTCTATVPSRETHPIPREGTRARTTTIPS